MDFSWILDGISDEIPRTTGPECMNYMTNRRRWIESIVFSLLFTYITYWAVKRLYPIVLPPSNEINKPHSAIRLMLLISMTFIFGMEMGFKFCGKSVIFVLNPCHIQTLLQIYLLAAKPSKTTIALFRIQMNNLNGPVLAFVFPEVECRTDSFEQATYWIQHALLYIIPVYIIRTGLYKVEEISDYNWVIIGVMILLIYHFTVLNIISIHTGINLNHMLCAATADPFQGQNYRIAAVIHESILCPILNKGTVLIFSKKNSIEKRSNVSRVDFRFNVNPTRQSDIDMQNNHNTNIGMMYHQQHTPANIPAAAADEDVYAQHLNNQRLASTEMSLAEEMAAAMGESMGAILSHRHPKHTTFTGVETIYDGNETDLILRDDIGSSPAAITAEYRMPTTKID